MNLLKSFFQFFKEAYGELKKVTWLGKKEAAGTTVVVILFVFIMSIFVFLVDSGIGLVLGVIL